MWKVAIEQADNTDHALASLLSLTLVRIVHGYYRSRLTGFLNLDAFVVQVSSDKVGFVSNARDVICNTVHTYAMY